MIFIFKKILLSGKACFCRNKSRLCLSLIIGLVLTGMIMQYISSVKADIEKLCPFACDSKQQQPGRPTA